MRHAAALLLLFFFCTTVHSEELTASQIVDSLLRDPKGSDILRVRGPHAKEAIEQIWDTVYELDRTTGKRRFRNREDCWLVLLRLGHRPAIEHFENELRRVSGDFRIPISPPTWVMVMSAQPRFIPALMEHLFDDDSLEPKMSDTGEAKETLYSPSLTGSYEALWIVRKCDEFTPETRSWAALQVFSFDSDEPNLGAFRNEVRTWWRQNERLIRDERYSNVLPPQMVAGEAHKLVSRSVPTDWSGHIRPASFWWFLVASCTVLVVGIVYFVLRRRPGKET